MNWSVLVQFLFFFAYAQLLLLSCVHRKEWGSKRSRELKHPMWTSNFSCGVTKQNTHVFLESCWDTWVKVASSLILSTHVPLDSGWCSRWDRHILFWNVQKFQATRFARRVLPWSCDSHRMFSTRPWLQAEVARGVKWVELSSCRVVELSGGEWRIRKRCINTKKTRNRSKWNFSMERNRLIDMMNMDELMDIWWQMIWFRIFSSRSSASRSFGKGPTCDGLDVDSVIKVIRSRWDGHKMRFRTTIMHEQWQEPVATLKRLHLDVPSLCDEKQGTAKANCKVKQEWLRDLVNSVKVFFNFVNF